MYIGIIVCSYTSNTLSIAQKLEQALLAAGHHASIARVEPVNEDLRASTPPELKSAPDITPYDAIIFASPVHAFSLAPLMAKYLSQISDLSGKKIYCFVTQHLKHKWMGGSHAVNQIKSACKAKGGNILETGVVNWTSSKREEQIAEIVQRMSAI
jgi:flavodoxin